MGDTAGFSSVSPTKKKSFKSGQIYSKDAKLAEPNQKSIISYFQFLFSEIWSILYSKLIEKLNNFEYKNDNWLKKNSSPTG